MNLKDELKKCSLCKKGFGCFKEFKEGELIHLDIFHSYEAGASFSCKAEKIVKKHILKMDDNGNPKFDAEFDKVYKELQSEYFAASEKLEEQLKSAVKEYWNHKEGKIEYDDLESVVLNLCDQIFERHY